MRILPSPFNQWTNQEQYFIVHKSTLFQWLISQNWSRKNLKTVGYSGRCWWDAGSSSLIIVPVTGRKRRREDRQTDIKERAGEQKGNRVMRRGLITRVRPDRALFLDSHTRTRAHSHYHHHYSYLSLVGWLHGASDLFNTSGVSPCLRSLFGMKIVK